MSQPIGNSLNSAKPSSQPIAVFGHKVPDTDAIVSAIAASEWLTHQGSPARPYRLGETNKETGYLFSLISDIAVPPPLPALPKNSPVCLVDHNESQQSADNLAELTVSHVLDHHKLGDLQTNEPAFIHFRPFGSCATIIFTLMRKDNVPISPSLAKLMVGAIISDTLNLVGPTTTTSDYQALTELATIAAITDVSQFAMALFRAKSDISDVTDEQLATSDYKTFSFLAQHGAETHTVVWGIAVIETVQPEQVFIRTAGLQLAMQQVKTRYQLDYLLVIVVDILQQQSWAIASDEAQNTIIETAFATSKMGDKIALGNRVSRKKQFVPTLQRFYRSNQN